MDKLKAKEMFRLHNVPTPPYYTAHVGDDRSDLDATHGSFGFPAIVKPRGSCTSKVWSPSGASIFTTIALPFFSIDL